MKEVFFNESPKLTAEEKRVADLHSLFNILNVLCFQLALVEANAQSHLNELSELEDEILAIAQELRDGASLSATFGRIRASSDSIMSVMNAVCASELSDEVRNEVIESMANLKSIYKIINVRLQEFELRAVDSDLWVGFAVDAFRHEFQDVFQAIEKNAKGRYRIFFNLARKNAGDYYIDLKIESDLEGGGLWVPTRLTDVLRDLTANARKYTQPGGTVALAVYQNEAGIRCVIEDNGYGIPEDELERVVEFGYRASNVLDRPTMGGGFGLTKAAWLIAEWGGTWSIASEVNQGTRIQIMLPAHSKQAQMAQSEGVG